MTPQALAVLETALLVLSPPHAWTRGHLATDHNHESCRVDSPQAYAFCATGALMKARSLLAGRPLFRGISLYGAAKEAAGYLDLTARQRLPHPVAAHASAITALNDAATDPEPVRSLFRDTIRAQRPYPQDARTSAASEHPTS